MTRKYYVGEPPTSDNEVPPGLVKVARMIATRERQPIVAVLERLLDTLASDIDADRITASVMADRRYCELEGLDYETFSRKSCEHYCKQWRAQLRKDWRR